MGEVVDESDHLLVGNFDARQQNSSGRQGKPRA
jgi:hypothetical protein